MSNLKQCLSIVACTVLCAFSALAAAKSLQHQTGDVRDDSKSVTISIRRTKFAFCRSLCGSRNPDSMCSNQAGELIYSSGLVDGHKISWALINASGETVPSGFYAYTLTVKELNSETSSVRRGHLIVERGRGLAPQTDRLWVTSEATVGGEASLGGGELTISTKPEASMAGHTIHPRDASQATTNLTGFGTTGRSPKFGGGDSLINSLITETFNGRIGIGTQTPGSLLTVAGQIETTSGGIKFPDGTVQMTSAAAALFQVKTNVTLQGDGTSGTPLGLAVPLIINGSAINGNGVVAVTNTDSRGTAIYATGGNADSSNSVGGVGLQAVGGTGFDTGIGGIGVAGFGGRAINGTGGFGGYFSGGFTMAGNGGVGVRKQQALPQSERVRRVEQGSWPLLARESGGATDGPAGAFIGDVIVQGNLSKAGGAFKIDHPLDPENKYLLHSFVESPDMKNVYDGIVLTDANGDATVTLPAYMEALNADFRYQLTVIGSFAQAMVASEINNNRFSIKTTSANVKVSWQVTGIRRDAYAAKNRIPVEQEKDQSERGYYLHPNAFNQPEEKSVNWARKSK